MGPTATLRHEHELVCRALAGADALADESRASGAVDAGAVRDFIDFASTSPTAATTPRKSATSFP